VVVQIVLITKMNMIWTLMLVKKFTLTNVSLNVTMLMNGIMMKDLINVPMNVNVMVSEPATTVGVLVLLDQKIHSVNYHKMLIVTLSMMILTVKNVM